MEENHKKVKVNFFRIHCRWLWRLACIRSLSAKLKRWSKARELRKASRGRFVYVNINPTPPKKILAKREKVAKMRGYEGDDYRNYVRYGRSPEISIILDDDKSN